MNAFPDLTSGTDAVSAALAAPAVAALTQAASRLQPLTPADVGLLNSAARLRLQQTTATLRAQQTALLGRAAAERALSQDIDLPQAMRLVVRRDRGVATAGASS